MLDRLRGRLRRLGAAAGAVWWFAVVLSLLLAVCAGDWWFHFDHVTVRIWLGIGLLLVAIVGALLLIVRPWVRPYRDLELARHLERIQPQWRGSLASSIEFAEAGCDPGLGAPSLQQSVIDRARRSLRRAGLAAVVSARPLVGAASCALLSCLAAAGAVAANPDRAALALERLILASTAADWPREHTLVLLDDRGRSLLTPSVPIESARGEPVTIYIDDLGSQLPDDATLHLAYPNGAREVVPLKHTTMTRPPGRERTVGFAVLPAVTEKLYVRATGGDDRRMPWYTYHFSPRPTVEQLTITTTAPEYLGGDVSTRSAESGNLECIVGSHVRIDAKANTPLASVRLCRDGEPPRELALARDDRSFHVEFPLDQMERFDYWFELTAESGLRSSIAERFEVVASVDQAPVVTILQPASDQTVTPIARLPVSINARDSHQIVRMRLAVSELPGSVEDRFHPLPIPTAAPETSVDSTLEISELGLPAGREFSIRAEAFDADASSGREPGRSDARTVRIISADDKLQELRSRQQGIAQSLQRALSMQTHAVQQTRELTVQWQTAGDFLLEDVDRIKRILNDQQRITGQLFDERTGVVQRAQHILNELEWNGIVDQPTSSRLSRLVDQLSQLRVDAFPRTESSLTYVRKALSSDAPPAAQDVEQNLIDAERAETAAQETLAALAALFDEWQRQYDVNRRVAEIREEQNELYQESVAVGQQTISASFDSLPVSLQAKLLRLAERQEQLSHQVERLEQQLDRMDAESNNSDANVATDDLREALSLLNSQRVEEQMQRAAHLLADNQVVDSAETQHQLLDSLAALEQILRGLGVPSPEMLLKQIETAESELQSLRARQEETLRKAQEMSEAGPSDAEQLQRLRREQQQLAQETEQWAQRLRRQQLGNSASSGSRAARAMRQATSGLQDETVRQDVLDDQQEALDDLLQAQRELAGMRRRLQAARAGARITELSEMLRSFIDRQTRLVEDTRRLDEVRQTRGNLTRAQLQTLRTAADAQSQLQNDVVRLTDTVADAVVFQEVLSLAAEEMGAAARLLTDRVVDQSAQRAQQSSVACLQSVLQALNESQDRPASADADNGDADQPETKSPGWSVVSQIRVVLSMQQDVASRTADLIQRANESNELTPADEAERARLETQQARLSVLLTRLLQSSADQIGADAAETPIEVTP